MLQTYSGRCGLPAQVVAHLLILPCSAAALALVSTAHMLAGAAAAMYPSSTTCAAIMAVAIASGRWCCGCCCSGHCALRLVLCASLTLQQHCSTHQRTVAVAPVRQWAATHKVADSPPQFKPGTVNRSTSAFNQQLFLQARNHISYDEASLCSTH